MASSNCWRGLWRPSVSALTGPARAVPAAPHPTPALFSTSSPLAAGPSKKSKLVVSVKGRKTLKIRKKQPQQAAVRRGPAQGERKALRKRVILSNANAIPVALPEFTKEAVLAPENIGSVVAIPDALVDKLRAIDAFKPTQCWGLCYRPGMLIREQTLGVAQEMKEAAEKKTTAITVLDGDKATGKSAMLLQSMGIAMLNDWVVMYIPEAQELTTAATDYAAIPDTTPTLYTQDVFQSAWMGQFVKANQAVLSKLKVTMTHDLPIAVTKDMTLERLAEIGAREPEICWVMFEALWKELTAPGRPPIFLGLDGLSHIMGMSEYRDVDFNLIHTHDFALIKHFVDHLSGAKKLPNGGAVMAATSKGNSVTSRAMNLALENMEQRQAGEELTPQDRYRKYDQRGFEALQVAKLLKIHGVTKQEARGLMEYWAASGMLRQRVNESSVSATWAVAGNGVLGEMERTALWMRI